MLLFILLQSSDSMYDLSESGSVMSFGSHGSVSSLAMTHSGAPELLVSLCYQSLTGRLTVEVLKASNLRNVSMQRAPGTVNFIILLYERNFQRQIYSMIALALIHYALRLAQPHF